MVDESLRNEAGWTMKYVTGTIPIEAVRSFVSIMDTGSFTKTATELNLTQPAVSSQIKRIEALVGEELFQRDGIGIILTDKGEPSSGTPGAFLR